MIKRKSIRILLINPENKILLFKVRPNPDILLRKGVYWFTPGGGMEQDETVEATTMRELFEETGLLAKDVSLGPVVWESTAHLVFKGEQIEQYQKYIVVHTKHSTISFENFTEEEKRCIEKASWFSYEELLELPETVYPESLSRHLPAVLERSYPETPLKID